MEVINRRDRFVLFFAIFFLVATFLYASPDTVTSRSYYKYLLDSAERMKLRGFHNEAINVFKSTVTKANNEELWEVYVRGLVEQADAYRFSYYYSREEEQIDIARRLMAKAKKCLQENLDPESYAWIRYNIYMGKLHRFTEYADNTTVDSLLIYLGAAEDISRKHQNRIHDFAKVNYELSFYHLNNASLELSKFYTEELLDISLNKLDKSDYFKALYLENIGRNYYFDVGDLERSALCLENALYLFREVFDDALNINKAAVNLANTYFYTPNSHKKALELYNYALESSQEMEMDHYFTSLIAYQNSSSTLLNLQDYDSCYYLSGIGISLNRNLTKKDKSILAKLKIIRAYSKYKLMKNDDVSAEFAEARQFMIDVAGPKSYDMYVLLREIAGFYRSENNLDSTLFYLQQSLVALFDEFNDQDIYSNPIFEEHENMEPVLYTIFDKAGVYYQRFLSQKNERDLLAALDLYDKAYEIMKRLVNEDMMDESLIQLFQTLKKDLQMGVNCSVEAYNYFSERFYLNKTFQFVEQSRYFLLLSVLQNTILNERLGEMDSLFLLERDLSMSIANLKHQFAQYEHFDDSMNYELRNELLNSMLNRSRIRKTISREQIASKKRAELKLDDVENELVSFNDIIVEFYRSESSFLAIVITKNWSELIEIPISIEMLNHISLFKNAISDSNEKWSKTSYNRFTVSSYYLYQQFFEPVLQLLKEKNEKDAQEFNFKIIADGELSQLPFEAFTTAPGDTAKLSYWGLSYLAKDYTISYAFSLNVLHESQKIEQSKSPFKILSMGYKNDQNKDSHRLNDIAFSQIEIDAVGSHFENAAFNKLDQATINDFVENASGNAIIHLAIHGQADTLHKFDSRLFFSPDTVAKDDGVFYSYRLYNIDLFQNQLSVLSACETGLGEDVEGEGIFSIARGFAYAGCPSLVMSLWNANDKSTYLLMDSFYEYLATGMRKDQAMQNAKIDFVNSMNDIEAHPSNWATFIVVGNAEPLKNLPSYNWYYVLGVAFCALLLLFFFKKRYIHGYKNDGLEAK